MKYHLILLISTLLITLSCEQDIFVEADPQLNVEGWIDADGFPVVILTETIITSDEYRDYSDLNKYVIKWAKVTISDGEQEVILTGKSSESYFPPYIYTTGRMRGVAGREYKLTVEYKDYFAEAVTRIPQKVMLDSVVAKQCNGSDSLFYIKAHFTDPSSEKNYYKFFTKVAHRDSFYLSPTLSTLDDAEFTSDTISTTIYCGNTLLDEEKQTYFKAGDEVFLKFAQIDSVAFGFWDMYKDIIDLSRNPLMPYSRNLPSNIEGGCGYWFGYGATEYRIEVK